MLRSNYVISNFEFVNFTNLSTPLISLVRRWRNHPSITSQMINQNSISKFKHLDFINKLKKNRDKLYWLVLKQNQPLGVAYFNKINIIDHSAFLGLYVDPQIHSQGWGKQISSSLCQLGFEKLGLEVIYLEVKQSNNHAVLLYKKIGFKQTRLKNKLITMEKRL